MAKEEVARFARKMNEDRVMYQEVKSLKTDEEVAAYAAKTGFDFTAGDMAAASAGGGTGSTPLTDDELEKASGGYYNDSGELMTTIAYGCQYWEPRPLWSAVKGQCGSCDYWDKFSCPTGDAFTAFGQPLPCRNSNNRKK
jgi:predicted ribosomally synthesized peptide with nif11-like leader